MKPFRFVHTADLHVDSPFKGLSEVAPALQNTMREATFKAVEGIVDLCIKREASFLVIAGDIHDAADRSLRALARLRNEFYRLADHDISVFLCHGNHDPLAGWGAKFTWPENVYVFGSDEVEAKPVVEEGLEIARIYGISYDTDHVATNLARTFRKEKDAPWAIGLLHANVGGDTNHMNYAPCTIEDLLQTGMDYWALGHVHTHKILRQANPVILYPGNPQGRHPRESGPRGCYVVEVNAEERSQVEFVPVDVVRWFDESLSIDGLRDFEELLARFGDRFQDLRRQGEGRGILVRWRLEGRGSLHRKLVRPGRLEDLLATLRDQWGTGSGFVWTESLIDLTTRDVDIQTLRQEENLLGDFLRLAGEHSPSLVEELRQVVGVLYDDPRMHRYLGGPREEHILQWIQISEQLGLNRLLAGEE